MDKTKMNLTIILILMLITGFIIYFMYLKPEHFLDETTATNGSTTATDGSTTATGGSTTATGGSTTATVTAGKTTATSRPVITCPEPKPPAPVAIVSRYFGVGFNIYPASTTSSVTKLDSTYLIEHIPITTTGVAGGMYSMSSDGTLTIKLKNVSDPTQWWNMTEFKDPSDNSEYVVMVPNGIPKIALQYANGSLSIRPYTSPGFEGQKWLKSETLVTRGIPVLNYSPASLFTTEFDPYSTSTSMSGNNLSDANTKQVTDVITAVKAGIQQYLTQANNAQNNGQMTSSSLGNKSNPLSVNLDLGRSSSSGGSGGSGGGSVDTSDSGNSEKGISFFDNVTGSTSNSDILSILDRYEANSSSSTGSNTIYSTNDLQDRLNTSKNGCKLVDIDDYTPNRVSTCNCKI
jgi:hypothetical protein